MMRTLVTRFLRLNIWVQAVLCLCVVGFLVNIAFVAQDIADNGILFRLHLGFLVLYGGQIAFIFLGERHAWAFAVLQGIMALLTNADFTCMPLVQFIGNVLYTLFPDPSLEYARVYQYVLISAAFTLQMLSAFILFSLLPKSTTPEPVESISLDN